MSINSQPFQNYLAVKLDVTKKADIDSAFKAAVDKFKRVDVVVNNAGYGLAGVFEELTEQQYRMQMEVNFFGLMEVTKKALEVMREQKPSGGVIQQVTSIGGQRGVPTFSIYCASKWAVEGFTEALSHELKPEWNIKLTCIEPGGFRTDCKAYFHTNLPFLSVGAGGSGTVSGAGMNRIAVSLKSQTALKLPARHSSSQFCCANSLNRGGTIDDFSREETPSLRPY
jgi:NAD(P)-dependent dehydrogenase (short-subunit alcohol dehydrogenase family)